MRKEKSWKSTREGTVVERFKIGDGQRGGLEVVIGKRILCRWKMAKTERLRESVTFLFRASKPMNGGEAGRELSFTLPRFPQHIVCSSLLRLFHSFSNLVLHRHAAAFAPRLLSRTAAFWSSKCKSIPQMSTNLKSCLSSLSYKAAWKRWLIDMKKKLT